MILKLCLNARMIWIKYSKKRQPIVTDLFFRARKLKVSLIFITQSYFTMPRNIRPNSTYYFIMKIPNKRDHQQIVITQS